MLQGRIETLSVHIGLCLASDGRRDLAQLGNLARLSVRHGIRQFSWLIRCRAQHWRYWRRHTQPVRARPKVYFRPGRLVRALRTFV